MAENIRPIWRDRIYGDDGRPRFDITNEYLPQLTPIIQEGTHHNSGRMNNLFAFDNLVALSGTEYSSTGWKTKRFEETITEAEADAESGEKRLIARRVQEEVTRGEWSITEELYDLNEFGQNVAVQVRIATMHKVGREWEAVVL